LPKENPDNHLCCSQSFCINTLFYFINKPIELNSFLKKIGYDSIEVLPFYLDEPFDEKNPHYICFEWIGEDNYLKEKIIKGSKRTRGKYFTSADFAIRYKNSSDRMCVILGEWKYTEDNKKESLRYSEKQTDRYLDIYKSSLEEFKEQFNLYDGVKNEDLFYDPFDQLMRLSLLAMHMEKRHEMEAQHASILLISPNINGEYNKVFYSPQLMGLQKGVPQIWSDFIGNNKFKHIYTEDLFNSINAIIPQNDWTNYLNLRYKWW
jgi:hypothetical protein